MSYFKKKLSEKKAVVFDLDDALYPQKDYLLQVYYLFSEFMEYTVQADAKAILAFMNKHYAEHGESQIFSSTAEKFNIQEKYQHNFTLLHENARLPLKLLLYKNVLELLQEVVAKGLMLFVIVDGNPAVAINKIKQMEWQGLQNHLKIYFSAEFSSYQDTFNHLLASNNLNESDTVLFVNQTEKLDVFKHSDVEVVNVDELL